MKIIILMIGLISGPFANAYSDTWFDCTKAVECKKVPTACGRMGAVNKNFEAVYLEFEKKNTETSSCTEPSKEDIEADKNATPACVNGKCEIVAPAKTTKKK